jgi:hypothetical protein
VAFADCVSYAMGVDLVISVLQQRLKGALLSAAAAAAACMQACSLVLNACSMFLV